MLGTLGCFDTPWVLLGIAFSKTQTSSYFILKNVPRWHDQVRQTESEEKEEGTDSEDAFKAKSIVTGSQSRFRAQARYVPWRRSSGLGEGVMVLAMESRPPRWSTGFGEGVPHIMSLAHERERTGEGLVGRADAMSSCPGCLWTLEIL